MNIHIIHKITADNLSLDKIRVVKPFNFENKYFFNIFYDKNHPLLIQTPLCNLPYRYMLYDNKYFQIDIFFETIEFKILVEKIITHIKEKIITNKKYSKLFKDKKYIDSIMSLPNNMFKLRAKNSDVDSINVYNFNRTKIDIRNVERNDQIKAIIQIEKFIIDKDSYTFLFKIMQIKKHCVIDTYSSNVKCLFIEDDSPQPIQEVQVEPNEYGRFLKMLKMGVPMIGVVQKMQLEGYDESDINEFSQMQNNSKVLSKSPCLPSPPPPPPPPRISSLGTKKDTQTSQQPTFAFLNDIKNGQFTLKKACIVEKDKRDALKEKLMKFVDKLKPAPPSLEEILNAKSRLKSSKQIASES
jgi:hypothetical protein